ncbi:MAG: PleD family two-component system response regulator [Leptolyngbyaceae cyanobacterium CRU_2_3]|nr:PleD family two-component system response regulator [Leptolyngbyaceae cyanobacterium CRU_2_3]
MNSHALDKLPLILLIDDDIVMRLHLRLCLEKEGYEIVEAKTGYEGIEAYSRLHPDIVLLDAVMPGIDGFECCAQLQSLIGSHRIPILMITGLEDQASVDRAFAVGAADYVTKPVHFAVLRQRVRRLIQQSQLQKQLEAANQELQRLVSLDGLTQLANRRRFDEYFDQEWRRMQREQRELGLVLCDIDFFKSYNDTYGHQAGDRCLQQVAKVLKSSARRAGDLVARYGGEEFALLLPNTGLAGAVSVAELACNAVRSLAIPHRSDKRVVTLSAGAFSVVPSSDQDKNVFVAIADSALYQAKAEGRDRCCFPTKHTTMKHL